MASRFVIPTVDVGSGIKPSSGAKLSFFETGTSTPKDTFTTPAATVANTNPVISDSNGVFPDIFIEGIYKVILTDKNDVQAGFGEADPVTSLSESQAENVQEIIDTNIIPGTLVTTKGYNTAGDDGHGKYFIKTASNATSDGDSFSASTTINLLMDSGDVAVLQIQGSLYINQSGAIADGVTDTTVNIAESILRAFTDGITLIWGPGVYIYSDSETTHVSDFSGKLVKWMGNSTTIKCTKDEGFIWSFFTVDEFYLEGIKLLGPGTVGAGALEGDAGIRVFGCAKGTITRVDVQDFIGDGILLSSQFAVTPVITDTCRNITVSDSFFDGNGRGGLTIGPSMRLLIRYRRRVT